MTRPSCLLALLLCISATAAAQEVRPARGVAADSATVSAPLPSVALPSYLDRVLRDYERAWRAGDAEALAGLFAGDGFVLQGGRPPVRGREAISAAYSGAAGGPLSLRALAYRVEGATGYIIGAYAYDATGDMGKFTLTLHKAADGRWLIFSDMDNASRRMRPAAQPAKVP